MIVIANEKERIISGVKFTHVVPYFLMYNKDAGYLYASASENNGIFAGSVAMPLNNMVFKTISEHYFECHSREGSERAVQYIERIMGVAARYIEDYSTVNILEQEYVSKHVNNFINECSCFILQSTGREITKFVASTKCQKRRCELATLSYQEFAKVANAKRSSNARRKKSS